jgi:hypothetical protein
VAPPSTATQAGSRVNTGTTGSNAVLGVMLVGPGTSSTARNPLRITSANNVIRGLGFVNFNRALMLDGTGATNNSIVGNWFGFNATGTAYINSGATTCW